MKKKLFAALLAGTAVVGTLNAATGAFVWSYPTGGDVDSSPVVVAGIVYFGSFDGSEYALDAATGALEWSTPLPGYDIFASPAFGGGLVFVNTSEGGFYA